MTTFIGGCRSIKIVGGVPPCRNIRVQMAVVRQQDRLTTRLSEKRIPLLKDYPGITFDQLRKGHVDEIKGLFIVPSLDEYDCSDSQSMIVFGKPTFQGQNLGGLQHAEIARLTGLARGDRLAKGVWGFIISPVAFSTSQFSDKTTINFSSYEKKPIEIRIPEKERDLFNKDTMEIDLEAAKHIGRPTAEQFWKEHVFAFLFRNYTDRDKEIWTVSAKSAGYGGMPKNVLQEFLYTLARHVAPEFRLYRFLTYGEGLIEKSKIPDKLFKKVKYLITYSTEREYAINPYISEADIERYDVPQEIKALFRQAREEIVYRRNLINIMWREAKYPNCLEWPEEFRLIPKGEDMPPDWWGI